MEALGGQDRKMTIAIRFPEASWGRLGGLWEGARELLWITKVFNIQYVGSCGMFEIGAYFSSGSTNIELRQASRWRLDGLLGPLGSLLEALESWEPLGSSWDLLGASWRRPSALLGTMSVPWRPWKRNY